MKNIIISDFREIDLIGFWNPAEEIPMIAIYVHPKDYPDKYAVSYTHLDVYKRQSPYSHLMIYETHRR